MVREKLIRNLKYTMEKHKNDKIDTFGTDISLMCKDILDYLEQQPSEDCVSRQVVADAVENTIAKYIPTFIGRYEKIPLELARAIKDVSPVTPARKKGEWIGEEEGYYSECSCCGASFLWEDYKCISNWKYCPICGAEMESEDNEQRKTDTGISKQTIDR